MKTKFDICDQVSYFNDASQKVESSTVQGIKIIATKVHANEDAREHPICLRGGVHEALQGTLRGHVEGFFPVRLTVRTLSDIARSNRGSIPLPGAVPQ